jgi:predicted RNase H-like HicB family nuclease
MTPMLNKKLKYYLHLQYPVRIVAGDDGLVGEHPDLPGCNVVGDSAPAVYAALEIARREWLRQHVAADDDVPLPNAYLNTDDSDNARQGPPQSYAQREATPF